MELNVTWKEVLKLNKILEEDDLKILILKSIHPEMTPLQIEKWFDNEISKSLVVYKIYSIIWKIRKLRGEKIKMQEVLKEIKEKNIKKQEIKKEMIDRFFQLFYETGNIRTSVREVLIEYGFPLTIDGFRKYLYLNYGDLIRKKSNLHNHV